ncbi:hypothetical protein MCOR25_009365 [Pyricularia grisea]|nr:hypothetical protein MCOR25_009365 [Pyricularia grisea]
MAFTKGGGATLSVPVFIRQTRALVQKNIIHLRRRWISTIFQGLVLPLALLGILLNIYNFSSPNSLNGFGRTFKIKTLKESFESGSGDLVFVYNNTLGPDVSQVVGRVKEPLAHLSSRLVDLQDPNAVFEYCKTNSQGISGCHAALIFVDSPLTPRTNGSSGVGNWSYIIRTDPSRTGSEYFWSQNVNVNEETPVTNVRVPLQLAVASAITNATYDASLFSYTGKSQEEADRDKWKGKARDTRGTNSLLNFLTLIIPAYHVVARITTERKEGVSQLVDVMGGGAAARVYSHVLVFNVLYLPTAIISGVFYHQFLFPRVSAAMVIFWYILLTMAVINSAIFAAAFFQGPRISSVVVATCFIALAAGAIIDDNSRTATDQMNLGLSSVFPACNYIYSIALMSWRAYKEETVEFGKTYFDLWASEWVKKRNPTHGVAMWHYFIFAILQIIIYPLLAVLAERLIHGISFARREFHDDEAAKAASVSIQTSELRKVYTPSIWRKIFCCGARRGAVVTALDGIDLTAQKQQIMCLLGVNGSGKTTTLELIGGMQKSTAGSVKINSNFTKLGVCPQRNTLFPFLTVLEHVKIWSRIKHGSESIETLTKLVEYCDLKPKINSHARDLSGGQKRKLQLACMLAGGSEVLLLDEVTSGLDPISRRAIWNIILGERSKRSMIFTTHFLDEAEILADHITLLSKGKIMCQGSGAELKNRFGDGYIVHIPKSDDKPAPDMGVPSSVHQDRVRYHVANTKAAAALITKLESQGISGVAMAGPTIEQVFLSLTKDVDETLRRELGEDASNGHTTASATPGGATATTTAALVSGKPISSFKQVLILMRKRLTILPRYWVAPLLALGLAAGLPAALRPLLIDEKGLPPFYYERPNCTSPAQEMSWVPRYEYLREQYVGTSYYRSSGSRPQTFIPVGPSSAGPALERAMRTTPIGGAWYNHTRDFRIYRVEDTQESWLQSIKDSTMSANYGGLFILDNSTTSSSAIVANSLEYSAPAMGLVGLWTAMQSGQNISVFTGDLPRPYLTSVDEGDLSVMYATFATLILTVYPVFFALYPAYEKSHNVRALQYANGIRPAPMWIAHLLSDFVVVLLVSIALTATVAAQLPMFWNPGFLFFVSILYGLAGILIGYIVASKLTKTQLSAFMATLLILEVQFVGAVLSFTLPRAYIEPLKVRDTTETLAWALGVFFPVVNVFKSFMIGLNTFKIVCRDNSEVSYPGDIYAYGGTILLLLIQVMVLLLLLIWLESNNSFSALAAFIRRFTNRKSDTGPRSAGSMDEEASTTGSDMMTKEVARVGMSTTDLLRVSHVSKSYKSNLAVDDVSLGLGEGEIMALLGPNGGGKTTTVNMIMGELRPDSGNIHVRDIDVHKQTRLAQRSLGVCQQFDALDLMTARQHLEFYARIKGVPDVKNNVQVVLDKTGLSPHAEKKASKLSGGNKRKLSLGIALIGNPDVLVLDEPSSSMDAASKRVMWRTLSEIGPGRSLLLTTHSMEEADALCTRAAILSKNLLAIGTTQELRSKYSDIYNLDLVLKSAPQTNPQEAKAVEDWVLSRFPAVKLAGESLGGQIKFTVPAKDPIGQMMTALEENKEELGLLTYGLAQPTLENVFISVVKDNYVEEDGKKKKWWQPW